MQIDKAIEILHLTLETKVPDFDQDEIDAIKLGVEGLERIKNCREHDAAFVELPLPGETTEEEAKRG